MEEVKRIVAIVRVTIKEECGCDRFKEEIRIPITVLREPNGDITIKATNVGYTYGRNELRVRFE